MRLKQIRQKVEDLNNHKSSKTYEFGKKDIYNDESSYMFGFTINEHGRVIKEICTTDRDEIVKEIEMELKKASLRTLII